MAVITHETEYPNFSDGDTVVLLSGNRILTLHSHILRQASPTLASLLDSNPAAKLTATAKRNGSTPYRFQLIRSEMDEIGRFKRILVAENGKPQSSDYTPLPSTNSLGDKSRDKDRYWEWLFGIFYGIMPKFDDSSLESILSDSIGLADAAEILKSVEHVRELADLALLRQGDVLWAAIANNPVAWSGLGQRLNSPSIYKEAVVHIIGKWQMLHDEDKNALSRSTYALCLRKWEELDLARQVIELRIIGHYPSSLYRSADDKPGRLTYSSDIFAWMGLCYFRHYFAQAVDDERNRRNPDGGWAFYTALAKGGDAYLHHHDLQAFHQLFPMSPKARGVLTAHMNVLKEDVKEFVKDLMKKNVHVVEEPSIKIEWLTCAVIEKEDLPWEDLARDEDAEGFEADDNEEFDEDMELDMMGGDTY